MTKENAKTTKWIAFVFLAIWAIGGGIWAGIKVAMGVWSHVSFMIFIIIGPLTIISTAFVAGLLPGAFALLILDNICEESTRSEPRTKTHKKQGERNHEF